jgi:hypothetical protein
MVVGLWVAWAHFLGRFLYEEFWGFFGSNNLKSTEIWDGLGFDNIMGHQDTNQSTKKSAKKIHKDEAEQKTFHFY